MTTRNVTLIPAPEEGVWRLGRANAPLQYNRVEPETAGGSNAGRFSLYSYGMLYCASAITGCFAEALATFRVPPEIRDLMSDADLSHTDLMKVGHIPSSWREDRILVRLKPSVEARFLDVDSEETREVLTRELSTTLQEWNITGPLTDEHIHGRDRRVARQIAAWAVSRRNEAGHQLVEGIAYRSGYGGRRCWAILRDTELNEVERRAIHVESAELKEVALEYGLTVR
ncbi:RES domain-containing protein [Streptomyces sp. NPDC058326]|uniref:RES domain-containing protein n=1 Tax=Streptomyces sp. NPDC058326 TaxID=3346447 RepID=UPI0036ED91E4